MASTIGYFEAKFNFNAEAKAYPDSFFGATALNSA
jgi:hypothetical protein